MSSEGRATTVGQAETVPVEFFELLTLDEVAAMLQVPKSWVYERTRRRGKDRLPFLKLGKYVRFEPEAVRAFLARQRKSA